MGPSTRGSSRSPAARGNTGVSTLGEVAYYVKWFSLRYWRRINQPRWRAADLLRGASLFYPCFLTSSNEKRRKEKGREGKERKGKERKGRSDAGETVLAWLWLQVLGRRGGEGGHVNSAGRGK